MADRTTSFERNEIEDGIFVYITHKTKPISFVYEVECAKFNTLVFEVNFAGSTNLKAASAASAEYGSTDQCLRSTLQPFTRTVLGHVTLIDPKDRATLVVSYNYLLKPVEAERMKPIVEAT